MKELILLRHAKSSWENLLPDIDRPLLPKGIKAITALSKYWSSVFGIFDIVISSPANRALHTAILVTRVSNRSLQHLQIDESLYTFNPSDIVRFIRCLPEKWNKVILVGHNPAFSEAARVFAQEHVPELKTADAVHFTFRESYWKDVTQGQHVSYTKKVAQSLVSHAK